MCVRVHIARAPELLVPDSKVYSDIRKDSVLIISSPAFSRTFFIHCVHSP